MLNKLFNPFGPGNVAEKRALKLVEQFSGHCLARNFFSLARHLVGFILVGKVFGKTFQILGLVERKGMWVVKQNFHGTFRVNVTWFFTFFSGLQE